jgi:hypothetical protein
MVECSNKLLEYTWTRVFAGTFGFLHTLFHLLRSYTNPSLLSANVSSLIKFSSSKQDHKSQQNQLSYISDVCSVQTISVYHRAYCWK